MAEIVVACRSTILRAPNGEQFRLIPGKTLADARHPAVQAHPDNWQPMEVELQVDEPTPEDAAEAADPGHLEDDLAVELAELREKAEHAEAEAAGLVQALTAISDGMEARGLIPQTTDRAEEGWLIRTVFQFIDAHQACPAAPEDVPPPRSRKPRAAARG